MAESEGIKEIVNQVAIQAATVVMMVLREKICHSDQPLWQAIESQKDKGTAGQYW